MTGPFSPLLQDPTTIPGWASLGVGGALAVVIFYFWRHDNVEREKREQAEKQQRELANAAGRQNGKQREDRLLAVVERNAIAGEKLAGSVDGLKDWLANGKSKPVRSTRKATPARRRRV